MDCRSKTYPRPSQLNLGFAGQIGDIGLDMGNCSDIEELRGFIDTIRELGEEQGEKFDNMPEGLQQGDTGQLLEERRDGCESWAGEIESACDAYDERVTEIDNMTIEELDLDEETAEDSEDIETARQQLRDEAFEEAKQAALDADPGL
jgi:hypothetical protein